MTNQQLASPTTRTMLLEAAGELFAQNGFQGTSVRDIVQKARASLSSVNYHFGHKELLYYETIRYVLTEKINLNGIFSVMNESHKMTPQQTANELYRAVRRFYWEMLSHQRPAWWGELLTRAMFELSDPIQEIFEEVAEQTEKAIDHMICTHAPEQTPQQRQLWFHALVGMLHHYSVSKPFVLRDFQKSHYDEELIDLIVAYQCEMLSKIIGLPSPEQIRVKASDSQTARA